MKRKAAATPGKTSPAARPKRRRGRPGPSQGVVGREAIIAAASQLLEKLPPHLVPNVLIARKAGVDPALVRYYFSNRAELLLAVVEHILANWAASHPDPDAPPAERLSGHVADMLEFSRRMRPMQRLMIDELAEAKSASVRARVRELNAGAVKYYAQFLRAGSDKADASPESLFMHVAVIGLCEFFAAAQAMILPLAPKHLDASELARRYETFIRQLVLDGVRARVKSAQEFKADA